MPVSIRCPNPSCGKPLPLPAPAPGARCPHCGSLFRLDVPAEPATRTLPPDGGVTQTLPLSLPGPPAAAATLDLPAVVATSPLPADAAVLPFLPSEPLPVPANPPKLHNIPERIGRFIIRRFLGEGAFGRVFEAYDPQLDRVVALKVAKPELMLGEHRVQRFLREAKSAANLRHPHIVPVFDSGSDAGHFYIASAFIPGRSLDKHLEELPEGQLLDQRQAVQIVRRLAEALAFAHQRKVVHRDVKPANVMLDESGEPLLMDFGLAARELGGEKLTQEGARGMGTPAYMSPEQGAGEAVAASDQYSLGCTLYELLTGQTPFAGPPELQMFLHQTQEPVRPRKLNRLVPLDLEAICLTCLEKEPAKRYGDCQALADDLRRWLDGEPVRARRPGSMERLVKWVKRSPVVASLLAGLVLVTVLGVSGILWKYFDAVAAEAKAELRRKQAVKAEEIAEVRRGKADTATALAKAETERANENLDWKDRELKRAEGMLYADNLLQAQLLWDAGNITAAQDRLAACRWDYRGWEHSNLRRRFYETHATFRGHTGPVNSVAFSADGKRIATGSTDRTVKVWDAASGQELHAIKGHTSPVNSVVFSPDGKRIATGSGVFQQFIPGELKVWDVATGQELLTLKGHNGPVSSVAFSPDGTRLASGSGDGTVKVWDVASGQELHAFKENGPVNSVAFSPDSTRLASGSGMLTILGGVKVWDVASGQELCGLKGHTAGVDSVAFSPDGKRIASGGFDKIVKVWDAANGQELLPLKGHSERVTSVAFSPDGKRIASGSFDKMVKVWDADKGLELLTLKGHTNVVASVVFSPDGKQLASSSGGLFHPDSPGELKLWDAASSQDVLALKGHTNGVWSVVFSPNGERLASGSSEALLPGEVKVWDAASGQDVLTLKGDIRSNMNDIGIAPSVVFSPDGKKLASGSYNAPVKLWNADSGEELLSLKGNTAGVWSVVFSPDGKRLASGVFQYPKFDPVTGLPSAGGSSVEVVKVWDTASGEVLLTLKGHTKEIPSVAFSPDSKRLVSGSHDQTVRVWDVATGQELLTLKGHKGPVNSVAFGPDGNWLASGSNDRTVKLWDASSGKELRTFKGHTNSVTSVVFNHDGKRLVSGSHDQTVKVWDAATGQELLTLKGHIWWVTSVVFRPDGNRLASAGGDWNRNSPGELKLWDAASGQDSLALKGHTNRVQNVNFSADGKRIVSQDEKGERCSWDVVSGYAIVPCTDPAPPDGQREATSADGKLRIWADGTLVRCVRTDDKRPSSDLVFLRQLNDIPARLRWHRAEAAASEAKHQWFAAAFHLRQLLAAKPDDTEQLRERLKRCEEKLRESPKP